MGDSYFIDPIALLAQAFGDNYLGRLYRITPQSVQDNDKQIEVINIDTYAAGDQLGEGTSYLGLAIMERITLSDSAGNEYDLGDCINTIGLSNTIDKTPVKGHPGTVKDYIQDNDAEIDIKGLLVSRNPYKAPIDAMAQLNEWRKKKEALTITSKRYNSLGIHKIVIENVTFPQIPSMINIQPYEIKALSDTDFSLIIIDGF